MTLASCAPEGTAARFQNSSPRAAPRGGDPPPPSQACLQGPLSIRFFLPLRVPSLAPPASRAAFPARHLLAAAFQSNSLGWHRAGARDKEHGAGDNARTSPAARSSAPIHMRCARGVPCGPRQRQKELRPSGSPRDTGSPWLLRPSLQSGGLQEKKKSGKLPLGERRSGKRGQELSLIHI